MALLDANMLARAEQHWLEALLNIVYSEQPAEVRLDRVLNALPDPV
jgi:hypothetical protein